MNAFFAPHRELVDWHEESSKITDADVGGNITFLLKNYLTFVHNAERPVCDI